MLPAMAYKHHRWQPGCCHSGGKQEDSVVSEGTISWIKYCVQKVQTYGSINYCAYPVAERWCVILPDRFLIGEGGYELRY